MIEYDNKAWAKLLFTTKGSILKEISSRVMIFTLISAIITSVHFYLMKINISPTPWTIVGLALGLLLVFRTNTSYDRYWEGRKMWGAINNASRSMAISIVSYIAPQEEAIKIKEDMIKLIMAFPVMVKQRLRLEKDMSEVKDLIEPARLSTIENSVNMPVALLAMLGKEVYKCKQLNLIHDTHLQMFNNIIIELNNAFGACERIRNTPLPIAYALHLKRFLYVFCFTITFALLKDFGWWSILITGLISYAFIGIEEIGIEIEDPFGDDPNDLPVEQICDNIGKTVKDILDKASFMV